MAINFKKQLFANNASTALLTQVSSSDTVINVEDATKFPLPTSNQNFLITIDNGVDIEVVLVTGRTASSFTGCVRGYESSVAKVFAAGSRVELRSTAGTLAGFTRAADRMTNIATVTELQQAELTNNHSYVIAETDDAGSPIVAVANNGRWSFMNYPARMVSQAVTSGSDTTTVYASTTDLSKSYRERGMLIQFITGANRGQCRVVTSAADTSVTWSPALPSAPAIGDRFEVYQSIGSVYYGLSNMSAVMPSIIDLGNSYNSANSSYDYGTDSGDYDPVTPAGDLDGGFY